MNVYTVAQINMYIKNMFMQDYLLQSVSVQGEVSNCKYHSSGHIYFTLKDQKGTLSCVMFAGNRRGLGFTLTEGQQVIVEGSIDIYERDGKYQLYARSIKKDGAGALFEQFEKLKQELLERGLFAKEYKQSIPKYIQTLGVVTASTGAAIRDIINITRRRNPYVQIILYPAIVQGDAAPASIVQGIRALEQMGVDIMIVGRGGGSLEDLWPFNEEIVARAIYKSNIPVISAVGHEIDITISDYVADLRAPTPTAAGELAVPDINTITTYLNTATVRNINALNNIININYKKLDNIKNSYVLTKPMSMYEIKEQKLDILIDNLNKAITKILENYKIRIFACNNSYVLNNPNILYKYNNQKLEHMISKLEVLNPLNTLNRGYAIIKKDNNVISSIKKVNLKDEIIISLKDGNIRSKIIKVGE